MKIKRKVYNSILIYLLELKTDMAELIEDATFCGNSVKIVEKWKERFIIESKDINKQILVIPKEK